jgi:CHAT domain-containing protein
LNEIQSKVLDDETVLLEYALGSRRSYLFAVTTHSLDVYTLPEKGTIEPACRQLYDLLTARDQKPPQEAPAARAARIRQADEAWAAAAQRIGRMLLTPARGAIGHRRLLVVTEGVLSYVPFGALPDPESGEPLMVGHEVVTAPSASVVAAVREEIAGRPAPAKTIAVFADPVFSAVDARVATPAPATRSAPDFARLRFSRAEADNIARLVAPGRMLKAVDFVATRELAMQPELKDYRILHFATHSVLDDEHPELSGVVLSLADRKGQPQNGYLRLYDIYNLRLNADLVVLSACRTALGREIHGEGLIGLTRGFLYAGAPSVLATLWEIDDRTTAEVMTRFYDGLLGRGERPAAALRAALIALWRLKGWQAPHYWAAFTLQGEWR